MISGNDACKNFLLHLKNEVGRQENKELIEFGLLLEGRLREKKVLAYLNLSYQRQVYVFHCCVGSVEFILKQLRAPRDNHQQYRHFPENF